MWRGIEKNKYGLRWLIIFGAFLLPPVGPAALYLDALNAAKFT